VPHYIRTDAIADLAAQLHDCEVTLRRDGAVAGRGVGANALGHPALALAHLVDVLGRQSRFEPLEAGEVITTGTLTAAMPIKAGETWSSEYGNLPLTGLKLTLTA
jgi:2-oxo-3-hexenedioate decarboxylase